MFSCLTDTCHAYSFPVPSVKYVIGFPGCFAPEVTGIPELNVPVVYPEFLRAACPPCYHDLIIASPFQERGKRPAGIPIAQDAAVRRKCAHLKAACESKRGACERAGSKAQDVFWT